MIYEKFDKAFGNVSAYALIWQGKPVGRVVIKFGAAATAYVHIWGAEMVSSRATGYGYDKATAAVMGAIERLASIEGPNDNLDAFAMVCAAGANLGGGTSWIRALEGVGFHVATVI